MHRTVFSLAILLATLSVAVAAEAPIRFWNLTPMKLTGFYLAPAGSQTWGMNQCQNDKDGSVDPDERLRITGIEPGLYDAKLADDKGKQCFAKNLKIEAGGIFSIEEKDLGNCQP